MSLPALIRRLIAEFLGTAIIGAATIGVTSGQQSSVYVSLVVAGTWAVMLLLFSGSVSVHLNPALTFFYIARSQLKARAGSLIVLTQIAGAVLGVWLGGVLGGHNWWQVSGHNISNGQLFSEGLATAVLIWLIGQLGATKRETLIPVAVLGWLFVAGVFTSSGAVANPALTIARMFTSDAGAEIGVQQGAFYILAQVAGVCIALLGMMFVTKSDGAKAKKKAKK
jgi:glycerol uptake facilitator-like aquaporin